MGQPGPFAPGAAPAPSAAWVAVMHALGGNPNVFMKVSAVFEAAPDRAPDPAPTAVEYYRPHLDVLWAVFGSERLIYGSNWPVCDRCGDIARVCESTGQFPQGTCSALHDRDCFRLKRCNGNHCVSCCTQMESSYKCYGTTSVGREPRRLRTTSGGMRSWPIAARPVVHSRERARV